MCADRNIRILESVEDSFLLHMLEMALRIKAHSEFIDIIFEELELRGIETPLTQ